MSSAGESFVIALAKASRLARRYLRRLPGPDRDDVLAMAILWCWENRASYQPSVSLEDWFVGAIRNALKRFEKDQAKHAGELLSEIPVPDDALVHTEVLEAAVKLAGALPEDYREVAQLTAAGYSQADIVRQGYPTDTVKNARSRIAQLRRLIPDNHEFRHVLRLKPKWLEDEEERPLAPIDRELARAEWGAPGMGKDCPSCWRCRWFDGFLPARYTRRVTTPAEPDVQQAIWNTEAEKLRIAGGACLIPKEVTL